MFSIKRICFIISCTNFEFTITSDCFELIVLVLQLSAIEGITELIANFITEDIGVTAYHEIPVVAAEVIIDVSEIRIGIIAVFIISTVSSAITTKRMTVCAYAIGNFRAVVNLGISTEADTIIPRIIILSLIVFVLITITDTSITSEFYVTNFVFEVGYANAEAVQFVSIFVSQFVDEGTLFNGSFVHVSHSFSRHFSCFITSDVAVALEVGAVYTLDNASVSEFYYGFVSPGIGRYINERVSCESASSANSHGCN